MEAALYAGRVAHIRHTPFRHRFDYRIWMLAVELDRLDELAAGSRIFAHNKAGLVSLHDKDHGYRDERSLRLYVEDALAAAGMPEFASRIVFITIPRVLGYAFSPISFYFCYDAAGRLGGVLHQVKNTFGDQVGYVLPVQSAGLIRQTTQKRMHVSPFFDMQGGYRFALTPPGEQLNVSIQYGNASQKRMTATMMLRSTTFSDASLLRLLLKMPLAPLKVILAIHWQALKLFLAGAKFHKQPAAPHEAIIAGET
jgi:DUF1365 family protein